VTLAPKGLLIEEQRTNLLLNSSIAGTSLATQSVTVTAVAHTLSFYGTGTVTLSGVSTAGPLVGTGVYPNRVSLTFTPTAGTLTLTVTGNVQFAQLEAGAFATSYIPTVASQVTRAADNASMIGNNFARWYNVNEGTLFGDAVQNATNSTIAMIASLDDSSAGGDNSVVYFYFNNTARSIQLTAFSPSGSIQVDMGGNTPLLTQGVAKKAAWALKTNDFAQASDGGAVNTDTSGAMPTPNSFGIGYRISAPSNYLNGTIKRIAFYPRRLANTELQGITS
jgi:hypothetical protein